MTLTDFDLYIRGVLPVMAFDRIDSSRNGLQVDRRDQHISRVATAVDAALEVFEAAAEWGADLLFVHHGLFWGREQVATGDHGRRLRYLIEHDIALYAVHLPLDADLRYGNNAVMAQELGLEDVQPFGLVKGVPIGVAGRSAEPVSIESIVQTLFGAAAPLAVLPFGPSEITTVGLISGGAPLEVDQAIEQGLDLYISGDANHVAYHRCREAGINAIFGGHYATETWGVRRMAETIADDTGIATRFLDVPTGM